MAGLIMIVLAIFTAIFCYFIAPDSSPFANRIILEIGGQKPGFTQEFIVVKNESKGERTNFFKEQYLVKKIQ